MKKWKFTPDGLKVFNGAMDIDGSNIDKSVQTFSGDGEWKHLYGVKLFVDKSGIVIKGMDPFIGRRFSDLERLNFADIFTVQRSIARATGQTNKAFETHDELQQKEDEVEKAIEYLEKRLSETAVKK